MWVGVWIDGGGRRMGLGLVDHVSVCFSFSMAFASQKLEAETNRSFGKVERWLMRK